MPTEWKKKQDKKNTVGKTQTQHNVCSLLIHICCVYTYMNEIRKK